MAEPTDDREPTQTLHQLIRTCMEDRGWSYTDLARRSGQALTRGRWQQLGSGVRQKNFPDPASLQVIAQVLEVDITTVVLGAAQAVGLDARLQGSAFADLLPGETGRLSPHMRDVILNLIRAAVAETQADHHASDVDERSGEAG